jgi:hypothetical protein
VGRGGLEEVKGLGVERTYWERLGDVLAKLNHLELSYLN